MKYLEQHSSQTLAEGLAEYYGSRDDLAVGRGLSDAAREFFRCHDTAHVVFGCHTTLPSEACVKMWSFFGTDAGFRRLKAGYRLPESGEIYKQLTFPQMIEATVASFRIVPAVIARSRRMTTRWPWADFDEYMDRTLNEIRQQFGIKVLLLD